VECTDGRQVLTSSPSPRELIVEETALSRPAIHRHVFDRSRLGTRVVDGELWLVSLTICSITAFRITEFYVELCIAIERIWLRQNRFPFWPETETGFLHLIGCDSSAAVRYGAQHCTSDYLSQMYMCVCYNNVPVDSTQVKYTPTLTSNTSTTFVRHFSV
jgi:hypothetical protein